MMRGPLIPQFYRSSSFVEMNTVAYDPICGSGSASRCRASQKAVDKLPSVDLLAIWGICEAFIATEAGVG